MALPFELFLFSYAVLGPLHYLTEIYWLRKKGYFVQSNKRWIPIFILFSILVSVYPLTLLVNFNLSPTINLILKQIGQNASIFLLIGFLSAVCFVFIQKVKHLLISFAFVIVFSIFFLYHLPKEILFIGIFLPTLIHVYLFTLLFILYGAVKSKSKMGLVLAFVLVTIPFIISFCPIESFAEEPSDKTITAFLDSSMHQVSGMLANLIQPIESGTFYLLSELGLRIQIFIAFAYTYHYLNWFSKTSIIGWSKSMSKKHIVLILFIWILSVSLYYYDYKTGFIALFFLSFLHVFLEFPLNVFTIKGLILFRKK